jgi:cytochrome c oxidase subunit 2
VLEQAIEYLVAGRGGRMSCLRIGGSSAAWLILNSTVVHGQSAAFNLQAPATSLARMEYDLHTMLLW